MAQPQLESFSRRGLALKIQPTPGLDSVPTAALNGILLMNGTSGTEFDRVDRNVDRAFFTGQSFGVRNKRAYVEGDFEIFSPSAPGQVANGNSTNEALLLPAGFTVTKNAVNKTTRYTPVSSNIARSSAYFWHVDSLKKIIDARHLLSSLRMAIGERVTGRARIQGSYTNVTKESVPNIVTYEGAPVILTPENSETYISTVNGDVTDLLMWGKELVLNMGSRIATKEFTSHRETGISGRDPTFSLRVARGDLADINPWALRDAGEFITGSMRVMETEDLYTEIGFRGQIEAFSEVEVEGDMCWEFSGPCVASSAGGDELYIEHGDLSV